MLVHQIKAPGEISTVEINETVLPERHAKVRITKSSVSLPDIRVFRGTVPGVKYPIVAGRHGVGVITEVGENNSGFAVGQRVAINPIVPCGVCADCKNQRAYECDNCKTLGLNMGGLFRNFAILPLGNLYQLPVQVKDEEAQFIEYVAMAIRAFFELELKEGEHIAIIGASLMGIIMGQLALYHKAVPILIDSYQERLATASEAGLYYTVNTSETDPKERVIQITGGRMCECTVYLANSNNIIQKAFDYSAPMGRIVIVGWENIAENMTGDIKNILDKQLRVSGINNSSKYFSSAINLLAKKVIDVSMLIEPKEYNFEQIPSLLKNFVENPLFFKKQLINF